jgi:hypothetical protein
VMVMLVQLPTRILLLLQANRSISGRLCKPCVFHHGKDVCNVFAKLSKEHDLAHPLGFHDAIRIKPLSQELVLRIE